MTESIETLPIPATERRLNVLPGYQIEFDPEPYIVLRMGFGLDKDAPLAFRPESLLARRYVVHEFKHSGANGSKWWTSRAGCDLFFALLKSSIRVVKYHGGSWPKVEVGGEVLTLNVSGGSGSAGGWLDWVRWQTETSVNVPLPVLKAVAARAMPVAQALSLGITLEFQALSDSQCRLLENALARKCLPALKPGMALLLAPGYQTAWDETRLTLERREPQHFLCAGPSGHSTQVTFSKVDWAATARANGMEVLQTDAFNFVAPRVAVEPVSNLAPAPSISETVSAPAGL